jgi:enterobactin synthetase component D
MTCSAVPGTDTAFREVVPSFASTFTADLTQVDAADMFDGIVLPVELEAAVAKRQLQFRAGRHCVRMALRALLPSASPAVLARGSAGEPIWPAGVTGSITHTDTMAAAVVARTADVASLGIDIEPVMGLTRAREIARVVAWPSEVAIARLPGFDRNGALTLVFSAKEAIFKCLYPLIGTRFGFHDVRVVSVDGLAGTFSVRLVKALSTDWHAGVVVPGRFAVEGDTVYTAVALPAAAVHACDAHHAAAAGAGRC